MTEVTREHKHGSECSVDEFVVGVPDLEAARYFRTSFRLKVRAEDKAAALYI